MTILHITCNGASVVRWSCPPEDATSPPRRVARMESTPHDGGRSGSGASARSLSVHSVSSEGSAESHVVEQEDIIVLTHDVRSFKEALGKLRRIFHPERDKTETMRVAAHERLGEVLRILRSILEKYPPIQSTELLMTAGTLIQQVKGYNYEDEKSDPSQFFDAIDQLALAFSSRVSDYLMGDLDSSTQPVPKTRSCDNLLSAEGECDPFVRDKRLVNTLPPEEIDTRLAKLNDGVDLALRRAKVWSKYAKDVMMYIEKRCCAELEHAKNLVKLAQTMRPILKEESFLPFQSIYYMALDQDFDNGQTSLKTCAVLQGHKFIEPLTARRNEHERCRKQIKDLWHKEYKRTHESIANLRKAKALYFQRQHEYEKAKESAVRAESNESTEASKIDKKRKVEDEALQKAMEAETAYKSCILDANERQQALDKVKNEVLQQVRELIYQCDQTMKAVTVGYFQLQSTLSAHAPVQFQTLCESSRLYEPGTQYMEFVKRLPQSTNPTPNGALPFSFEYYTSDNRLDKSRKSNGSNESSDDILNHGTLESRLSTDSREKIRHVQPIKAWGANTQTPLGSDSDSMSSCPSNKSQDTSPAASPHISARKIVHISSGDELETDHDNVDTFGQTRRPCMSKAADTHSFRRLKTPSRCRECDSYVYFHGFECLECGLASHKKCLESLAIQCGRKRLLRKMTTFGVDLTSQAQESGDEIPYIVNKCIAEVEDKGFYMKGIYRVSGVKSKVEKLCQSFENGAELVDLDGVHPNVVSNVLKLYLRQLPEPLLTYRLYPDFIKIAKDFPSQKCEENSTSCTVLEELKKIVQKLPSVHLSTLKCLMYHLYRVSEHSNHNNMPPSNLGIVFGPTLLRTSEGSASLSSLVDTVHQTRVIELLISHAYEIFGVSTKQQQAGQEDEVCSEKAKPKSVRYRSGKQNVVRTMSGSSQLSDFEETTRFIEIDHKRDGIPDLDDYPIPGYLPSVKHSSDARHGSEVTRSSEDLLYSTVISDDDYPEIMLPDDASSFKRLASINQYPDGKMNGDLLKPVLNARASLSSSPAVSEASHCSSLMRSTDDEDATWKETVTTPRKNVHNQTLHPESKLPPSTLPRSSESSGVSSAASTSPTVESEVYTSSAVVDLKQRVSTSAVTAELRRQFFELPPPLVSVRGGGTVAPSDKEQAECQSPLCLTPIDQAKTSPESMSPCIDTVDGDLATHSQISPRNSSTDEECGNPIVTTDSICCSSCQGASRDCAFSVSDPVPCNALHGREDKSSAITESAHASETNMTETINRELVNLLACSEKHFELSNCSEKQTHKPSNSPEKRAVELSNCSEKRALTDCLEKRAVDLTNCSEKQTLELSTHSDCSEKQLPELFHQHLAHVMSDYSTVSVTKRLVDSAEYYMTEEAVTKRLSDKLSPNRQPRFV